MGDVHFMYSVIAQVAQAVLVPLLVNKEKIGPSSLKAIKSMMVMDPPLDFKVTSASCDATHTLQMTRVVCQPNAQS